MKDIISYTVFNKINLSRYMKTTYSIKQKQNHLNIEND